MPLWGANTTNEAKPVWVNTQLGGNGTSSPDIDNVFATSQGWVLRHYKDSTGTRYWDEILVAASGLDQTFANAGITSVYFSNRSNNAIQLTFTGISGNTAYAVGETVTQSATGANGVVSFANSTVVQLTNASAWFVNTSNSTTTILGGTSNALANVASAAPLAPYVRGWTNGYVTVVYNEPVTVAGAPTMTVTGTNVNATATYSSGSGTNKLVFKFTVPANNQSLSILGQTIATGASNTIVDSANASVNAAVVFANSAVYAVSHASSGSANVSVL